MLDVGNRVITKSLGPPVTGMVVCIYDPKFLCVNNAALYNAHIKKYPGLKRLFGVLLDSPIRKLSMDEFNGPMKHVMYLSQPGENFAYYAENELELFHDYIEEDTAENTQEKYQDFDSFPGQL